jgi:tetratricopeptide (TPR) repeat protein
MRRAAVWLSIVVVAAPLAGQEDPLVRGDRAWRERAAGYREGRVAPEPIAVAVGAYEEALEQQPRRLEGYWKLMRALYFQGQFVARDKEAKRVVFDRGRHVAEAALDLLGEEVGGRKQLEKMEPEQLAAALAHRLAATPIYFWGAVNWGLWGEVFGKVAAARRGVAKRLRGYSLNVIALDEEYEAAGGHRLLGRLHTMAPKIPLVTGWVDRDTALSELRRAVELAPEEPYNVLYLAEAELRFEPAKAEQAIRTLKALVERLPDPEQPVESGRTLAEALALLNKVDG